MAWRGGGGAYRPGTCWQTGEKYVSDHLFSLCVGLCGKNTIETRKCKQLIIIQRLNQSFLYMVKVADARQRLVAVAA